MAPHTPLERCNSVLFDTEADGTPSIEKDFSAKRQRLQAALDAETLLCQRFAESGSCAEDFEWQEMKAAHKVAALSNEVQSLNMQDKEMMSVAEVSPEQPLDTPLIDLTDPEVFKKTCWHCGRLATRRLSKCAGCLDGNLAPQLVARYCNHHCQKRAWTSHRLTCPCLT